ncbi:hypothetical protein ACLB1S_02460 [Escherichia coli]
MIHVKGDVNEETFNEADHAHHHFSHYGIVASTETAAAMMKAMQVKGRSTVPLNVLLIS